MSLSQDDVVTIVVQTSAPAVAGRSFSTGNILGKSTVLPLNQRTRVYAKLTDVAVDFGPTTEEYKAAQAWFGQKRAAPLKISRQFLAAQPGSLLGSGVSGTPLASFTAITTGGFDIALNGSNHQLSSLDFSAATSMADVAADLQTALAAALASTTCTWNGTSFVITSPTTGTGSTVGYAVAPTHSGSPVDVSSLLGLDAGDGAQSYTGIAIETLTDALNATAIFDPNFFGLALAGGSTQDQKDAMAWAEAGIYMLSFTVTDPTAKLSATTTDLGSYAHTNGYENSFGTWASSAYAGVSALSRLLLVDLTQANSAIALFGKQLPGIAVDVITETERLALEAKNLNYYTTFAAPGATSGFAMFAQGKMADGTWIDQVFNLGWVQANLQNSYFVAITGTPTKVALTDRGMAGFVKKALDKVMDQAVRAGILAPGQYSGADVGSVKQGDFLKDGYYTYILPVSTLSDSDRGNRIAPATTIIGTGAGAVQKGSVVFAFQQ
jgi:uncharacterized protein DUF3383